MCHSLGLTVRGRYAEALAGSFNTKTLDPLGSPAWNAFAWDHHMLGWDNTVFDPCVRLNFLNPRVPVDENLVGTYWPDLYLNGSYQFLDPFRLGEDDPLYDLPSEVD